MDGGTALIRALMVFFRKRSVDKRPYESSKACRNLS
jgi:hypothetical protein